jgi:hypothetical protein
MLIKPSSLKTSNGNIMSRNILAWRARKVIRSDTASRDPTTARRCALLEILWHERYLTEQQLIIRVELRLGKNPFGTTVGKSSFYRDMKVVKQILKVAGYVLLYSRNKTRPGYYLKGQPALSPELRQIIRSSAAEVDPRQIDIYQRLSPAQRFQQGCAISDTARNVVAYRIRQENPRLSAAEANRLALQRAYMHESTPLGLSSLWRKILESSS